MKRKIADLGGMSLPYTIDFFSDKGSVEVDIKDKKEVPKYTKRDKKWSFYRYVKKIPFVRGFAIIFDFILKFFRFLYEKKLYLLGIVIILIYLFFAPKQEVIVISERSPFWDNFLVTSLYLFVVVYIFCATKNHGAEHKLISAYETTQDLTLKNIKKQSKENRCCGTVLALWLLIFLIPLDILYQGIPFKIILIFPVAYEIFLLARKKNLIGNLAYFPGWLGQKITTREPDDKLLLRARIGLRKLLDAEKHIYKI